MIDTHWQELRIGDLISSADSGISLLGEARPAMQGETAILTLSAVSGGIFRPDQCKVVNSVERGKLSVSPKCNRILISRSNTPDLVGAAVYIDSDYPDRFLPDLIWQLEPRAEQSFSMRWFCYWLQSDFGRSAIKNIASGSSKSMVKISRTTFFKIPITVPSPPEQKHMAGVLSTWDSAIDLTTQLITAMQQYKRGLMQQLLMRKKRFREFADKSWTQKRLGELFLERREAGWGDLPLLSITNKDGIVPRDSVERRDTSNEDKSKYLRICKGDIGYNTMRMWQGVSAVSSIGGIVSPAYTICIPREGVDAHFMGHLFKSPQMIHLFSRYSQGMVDDTLSLKFDVFSKIEVIIPCIEEQKRIAEVFDTCDQELALLNRKLALLKKQKQGLMQQLLTGKVRVNT